MCFCTLKKRGAGFTRAGSLFLYIPITQTMYHKAAGLEGERMNTTMLDINVVVKSAAELIAALGIIFASLKSVEKYLNRPKENKENMDKFKKDTEERTEKIEKEIKGIKKEQCVQTECLMAIMDGLKQLGANGPVTEAHRKLSQHIINNAYDDDGK